MNSTWFRQMTESSGLEHEIIIVRNSEDRRKCLDIVGDLICNIQVNELKDFVSDSRYFTKSKNIQLRLRSMNMSFVFYLFLQ